MVSWKFWRRAKLEELEEEENDGDLPPSKVRFSPQVKRQLWILSLCRFAEPVALTSVFPYLYFMIQSFDVPEEDIAFWVGLTSASFALAQFISGVFWGRASDRFGRKPTILAGLAGTLVAAVVFGFAKSLPMAIFARCLAGMLNGNVGIIRTFVAEIVPEKELQPVAFSLMPLVWAVGSIFGPCVGGYLSDPVQNHPRFFSPGGLFSQYPYALPNLFNALLFACGLVIGYLFLEESLEHRKDDPDFGRELGKRLTALFHRKPHHKTMQDFVENSETSPLLTPRDEERDVFLATPAVTVKKENPRPPAIREAFTFQSTTNIIVYTFLALHTVSYDQLLPVYMSYPRSVFDPENPLRFFGGFGLSSAEIGVIFSTFGFCAMINQFFIYPPITRKLGPLLCLKACLITFPIVYFLNPFVVAVDEKWQKPFLYTLIFVKNMAGVFAFPSVMILVTNSAPSLRVLGTLNGVATAFAALGRAVGPSIGGAAFSFGQRVQYIIIPWWMLTILAIIGALPTWKLVEGKGFARSEPSGDSDGLAPDGQNTQVAFSETPTVRGDREEEEERENEVRVELTK